jgi:hypothetical protein
MHACEMTYERCTPVRDARLRETRLWDGFYEKHAYERRAYAPMQQQRSSEHHLLRWPRPLYRDFHKFCSVPQNQLRALYCTSSSI